MAVPVTADTTFEAGIPKALFQTSFMGYITGGFEHYAVSPDGQRFLLNVPAGAATEAPITIVLNWPALLKK